MTLEGGQLRTERRDRRYEVARQHGLGSPELDILLPDLPTLRITPYLYLHIASYPVRRVCYLGVGSPSGFERYKAVSLVRLRAPVLCGSGAIDAIDLIQFSTQRVARRCRHPA